MTSTPKNRPPAVRGFTLIETLVAFVLLTLILGVILNLTITSKDAQHYSERLARATEVNENIVNGMRSELLSSIHLISSGSVGDEYLAAFEFDPNSPLLAGSKLPTIITAGEFRREATSGEYTGNVLVFARQAWTTEFTCTSTNTYLVDVYRLVCYYLTSEDGGPSPGSPLGLNLTRFVSEPLAEADQVNSITDLFDQQEVLSHLANGTPDADGASHPQTVLVWARGQSLATTGNLQEIDPGTGTLSTSPLAPRPSGSWKIRRSPRHSHRGLLHYRRFSVASNHGSTRFGVGRFGVMSSAGEGFPHGFEIQVNGISSARQVLVHLSIVSTNRSGTTAHSDLRTITFVQDV